jgi:hypothetical protein
MGALHVAGKPDQLARRVVQPAWGKSVAGQPGLDQLKDRAVRVKAGAAGRLHQALRQVHHARVVL